MKTITYNPETHRLVPVEPTRGIQEAIYQSLESGEWATAIYRAMLSAAPQPEPVESEGTELNSVEPVAWMVDGRLCLRIDFIETIENWKGDHVDTGRAITYAWKPILYTAPPDYAALKQQLEEIKRQRDELVKALEWQPIETAPKDGQAFDVWVMSTKNKSYGVRMTNVYYNNGVICGMRYPDASFGEYASHWMPLPAAPAALASVKGGATSATCLHTKDQTIQTGDGTPVSYCPDCGRNEVQHELY